MRKKAEQRFAFAPKPLPANPKPMPIDTITIERASLLHPAIRLDVISLLSVCVEKQVPIRIVQGLRTHEDQSLLYGKGRSTEQLAAVGIDVKYAKPFDKIVTKALPGSSWHSYGLAIDFCLLRGEKQISWDRDEDLDRDGEKDWGEVVNAFMSKGFEWGGNWTNFPDYPHLQKTFGLTIKKAKELIAQKKVDSRGYIIF